MSRINSINLDGNIYNIGRGPGTSVDTIDFNGVRYEVGVPRDGNIVHNAVQKGFFGYAGGKRVDGSLEYLGSEPTGTGCAMYNNGLYSYFGNQSSPYILTRGVRIEQNKVASAIGLTQDKLVQGNTILGIRGTGGNKQTQNPMVSVGYGRVCSYEVGDPSHPYLQIAGSSGWVNSAYGILMNTGIHGYGFNDNYIAWKVNVTGNYTVRKFGEGRISWEGTGNINAGTIIRLDFADTTNIYWKDTKSGGFTAWKNE